MPRYHPKSKLLPLHLLHNLHGFQACCKVLQYIALLMCGLKLCFNAADDTLTKNAYTIWAKVCGHPIPKP